MPSSGVEVASGAFDVSHRGGGDFGGHGQFRLGQPFEDAPVAWVALLFEADAVSAADPRWGQYRAPWVGVASRSGRELPVTVTYCISAVIVPMLVTF